MAGFDAFDREIRLATEGISEDSIGRELAKLAKRELARAIADGASPIYERYVNSRPGVIEEEVIAPGPIVYEFALWEPVISFALDQLRKRSPVKTGQFRNSFIVIVGESIVTDFDAIPARAEVIITNFQPYVRKAEVGRLGIPARRIFDGTKRSLSARFGNQGRNTPAAFRFETQFLSIGNGIHPSIPYVLKRSGRSRRKDRQAGQPITYPAIILNMVF